MNMTDLFVYMNKAQNYTQKQLKKNSLQLDYIGHVSMWLWFTNIVSPDNGTHEIK